MTNLRNDPDRLMRLHIAWTYGYPTVDAVPDELLDYLYPITRQADNPLGRFPDA